MNNTKAFEFLSLGLKSISLEEENEIYVYECFSKIRNMIKAIFNSLIDQAGIIQNTIKCHKTNEVLDLIVRLNTTFKRNLNHELEDKKSFNILYQIKDKEKINLIKHFLLKEQTYLSTAKINIILAEKIIKSLICTNDFYSIKISYLNKIDLNANKKLRSSIKHFLTEEIKKLLFNAILLSKNTDSVNLAASNAITLLNKSRYSFANKDLSRIKIPNADLSWGSFINTNFESSYLYGVNFSQSHIYDSNFRNCNMINVNFGKMLISSYRKMIEIAKFSPCGRYLAIVIRDKAFLYDAKTFQNITQLIETKAKTNLLLFSDNGNYLALMVDFNLTMLWDVTNQIQIAIFVSTGYYSCFSPCNNYFFFSWKISRTKNIVKIYSINTKSITNEIRWLDLDIHFVSFSSSGKNLIIFGESFLSVWNLSTRIKTYQTYCSSGNPVSVSFNRKYIFYFSLHSKAVLFCTEKLEPLMSFDNISNLIFSNCGKYIAIKTQSNSIKIVNLLEVKEISEFFSEGFLDFYPHEKYVLAQGKSCKNWKLLKIPLTIKVNNKLIWREEVREACFSGDSKLFALLNENGWISVFFTENQKLLNKFRACKCSFEDIAWADTILASSYCKNKSVKLWNVYDGTLFKEIHGRYFCPSTMFSPDGKKIISNIGGNKIGIIDVDSDQIISIHESNQEDNNKWYWSQSGDSIISINDKKIDAWIAGNKELFHEFQYYGGHDEFEIRKSCCGKFLIYFEYNNIIGVWDLRDLTKIIHTKTIFNNDSLCSIMWSSDSKSIVAGNEDGSIIIWDYDAGKVLNKIKTHSGLVRPINISKQGHFISYGKWDETIKLWNFDLLKYYQKEKSQANN